MGRIRINDGKTKINTFCTGEDIFDFLKTQKNKSMYIKRLILKSSEYTNWCTDKNHLEEIQ